MKHLILSICFAVLLGGCAHPFGWYFTEESCDKSDTRCRIVAERLKQGSDKFTITLPPVPAAGKYAGGYWTCTGKTTVRSNIVPVTRVHAPCGSYAAGSCYVDATDSIQLRTVLTVEEEGNVLTHEALHAVGCHHRKESTLSRNDHDLHEVVDLQGTRFTIRARGEQPQWLVPR